MKNNTKSPFGSRASSGFVLLEVLVGLLIFSIAILGMVAFQAFASKSVVDSRFRTEAVSYADELIGLMSTSDPGTLVNDFSTAGAKLATWKSARLAKLPAGAVTTNIAPLTKDDGVTQIPGQFLVSITIQWKNPGDAPGQYVVQTVVF